MNFIDVKIIDATSAGRKKINEDSINHHIPNHQYQVQHKGIGLALADGVSTAEAGQEASQTAVKGFIEEYYRTPNDWSISKIGQKILTHINLSLFKKSQQFKTESKGFLCTFSALIFHDGDAHFFHAGDSRIYLIRNNTIQQLTTDHILKSGKETSLIRALGMDNKLSIDYGKLALKAHDYFIITSDGIHDFISDHAILSAINQQENDDISIAEQLINQALINGSDDNISIQIAQIKHIGLINHKKNSSISKSKNITRVEMINVGDVIDGYQIKEQLSNSYSTRTFKVCHINTQIKYVMKCLKPSVNAHAKDLFYQQEWLAKRLHSDYIIKIHEPLHTRCFDYYLTEYVNYTSLKELLITVKNFSPKNAIKIVKQLIQAVSDFHDADMLYHNLTPEHILIDSAFNIKVLSFNNVYMAGVSDQFDAHPKTQISAPLANPYFDPHIQLGRNAGLQSDIYAIGCITYQLFTGRLPYGDEFLQCKTALDFDRLRYISSSDHKPTIPLWFDKALEKSVNIELSARHNSVQSLLKDLTTPNPDFLWEEVKGEQDEQKLLFWKVISGLWLTMLAFFITLFAIR